MYTLKSIAKRGATLSAAFVLVVSSLAASAAPAFADSLNPLTHRSLTLSSSSPGWSNTDGSGNSTYAPPNSGANGQKTGNTFAFNVSTDTHSGSDKVKAMTFQYCTTSAGDCQAPGDNTGDDKLTTRGADTSSTSDLNVNFPSPTEVATGTDFDAVVNTTDGVIKAVPGFAGGAAASTAGNFVVFDNEGGTWHQSSGWNMAVSNVETDAQDTSKPFTGKNNYITLWNTAGDGFSHDTAVKVVFFGTGTDYITNPGSGAFFVKINTYKAFTGGTAYSSTGPVTAVAPTVAENDVIDGGVTVANVMNQSIQITTKVLETMQFSVGTVDPNTLSSDRGANPMSPLEQAQYTVAPGSRVKHTPCDPILTRKMATDPANVLQLGNQSAESSLEVAHTYSTHSYWRLSSNSSAGATVYYSGHTLSNTVGDQIDAINGGTGIADAPQAGSEQFGLALDNSDGIDHSGSGGDDNTLRPVSYAQEATYENGDDQGITSIDTAGLTTDNVLSNGSWHTPQLAPLGPTTNYGGGTGDIEGTPTTTFAFNNDSDTIPAAIATENSQVVDCVTGKMRYMANIAATTPAGIYTTKINYIAAPQY